MRIRKIIGVISIIIWIIYILWAMNGTLLYKKGLVRYPTDEVIEEMQTYAEAVEEVTGIYYPGQIFLLGLSAGILQFIAMRKKKSNQ